VLEIYNENIKDLLVASSKSSSTSTSTTTTTKYELRNSVNSKDVEVLGLSKHSIHLRKDGVTTATTATSEAEEAIRMINRAFSRRSQASTLANLSSSRSHCIVKIQMESRTVSDPSNVVNASLYLVDLAGSECVAQSVL